jgi:hypothetical protein
MRNISLNKSRRNRQVADTARETAGLVRYIGAREIEERVARGDYIEAFVYAELGIEKILWERIIKVFKGGKAIAVRQAIEDSRKGKDKSRTSTFELIKWAHFLGAITEDEFNELINFNNVRNRIIHGHGLWWDLEEYKEILKEGIRFLRENGFK